MTDSNRVFLNTGLDEFNDLLTGKKDGGIAMPGRGGIRSSSLLIKAPAGARKSVLASFLAYNLHTQPQEERQSGQPAKLILPFVVYFSFAQPAIELRTYIKEIIASEGNVDFPLILSPTESRMSVDGDGLAALQRCLVDQLTQIIPYTHRNPTKDEEFPTFSRSDLIPLVNKFKESSQWDVGLSEADRSAAGDQKGEILPIIVVDPVNHFFDYRDTRATIATLFQTFRILGWPIILTLEDPGAAATEIRRQWASDVEFEADVVLNLSVQTEPYTRRRIEVTKSRHASPRFGIQPYRIEQSRLVRGNSMPWETSRPGVMIYKSTHWVISDSRTKKNETPNNAYYSGIARFDRILREGVDQVKESLPKDAMILVGGQKGGHKLTLAFNLLVVGLWSYDERPARDRAGALLLSFGEETGIHVPDIALAYTQDLDVNAPGENSGRSNGDNISWIREPEELNCKKIIIKKWSPGKKVGMNEDLAKEFLPLIEITFKPGYLSPEEFLWIVDSMIQHYQPNRVLVDNTAHLRMRFPALAREEMLFPAISSLTQAANVMLIIINVSGEGSDDKLTYGLEAAADYVVDLDRLEDDDQPRLDAVEVAGPNVRTWAQIIGLTWAKLSVRNVRDKNYNKTSYAMTVAPMKAQDGKYALFILDKEVR